MPTGATRIGGGLLLLIAVWIGVYWWTAPVVRFEHVSRADDPADLPQPAPTPGPQQPRKSHADQPKPPKSNDPPEPNPGIVEPEFILYSIRSGDTLEGISERQYGTRRHADAIARANPFMNVGRLAAGRQIRLPKDPANVQGRPAAPGEGEPRVQPAPTPKPAEPEGPTREYVVQQGDTLSTIAKRMYGSIKYVDLIWDANREALPTKDDLRLGQKLVLPPKPKEGP